MIEIDASALQQAEKMLQGIPGAAKKAVSTAARKTVRGAKKDAVQKVRERYTIKATYITRTMSFSNEGSAMSFGFKSKGRVNDLAYFKHNPGSVPKRRPAKGKYLYSQVVKGEGGTIAHAFLAKLSSGHIGVFRRNGKNMNQVPSYWRATWGWGAYKGQGRKEGITKLSGPSTPQMLGSPTVADFIQKRMEERLAVNVEHEVNAFLMGFRR